LRRLLTDAAPAADQAALLRHLEHCAACRQKLDGLAGVDPALLEAARALRHNHFQDETPLRNVLDCLGNDPKLLTLYRSHDGDEWSPGPTPPAASLDLLGVFKDYEGAEVLGRGGMGQVFKAFDRVLKRWVAIKVLAPSMASDETARQRFLREAQAAAAVRHENVVTIHAVDEANGLLCIVMEYLAGGSLQEYLDRHPPPEASVIARLGAEIASGLAAAHAQGLIHRDIKPSNILLGGRNPDPAGSPLTPEPGIAKIGDFGLARIMDDSRLTRTGVIAGTPMYMAPEQVLGEALDPRADLFSLGSALYTLCTGREPFAGDSPMAVIRQVCEVRPTPIHALNPAIPPWLAAVVERLHAKRRDERFASAAEVTELLRYNLEHPQQLRPVPPPQSVVKAKRKKRRLQLLGVAALFLLIAGLPLGWWFWRGAAGRDWAAQGEPHAPLPLRTVLQGHSAPIWSIAFSPDGKLLATGSDDTSLRLWDAVDGRSLHVFSAHNSTVFAVLFAHKGPWLLGNDGDGTLRQWDLNQYTERQLLTHHNSNARRIALSPDDRTAAIANIRQGVDLWDLEMLTIRTSLPGEGGSILALAFAPDGQTLATGDTRGRIRLWDPATGRERAGFAGDEFGTRALAFTPDSRTLASAGNKDHDVKLWDVAKQQPRALLSGLPGAPLAIAFSPTGALLAASTREGAVVLWDVASQQIRATIPAHQGAVWALAFSPDGRTLATGGDDRLGKLWDLSSLVEGVS
jgi:serine/threonine protein kinase